MDRCAPNKKFEQGSCFTIKDLENITNEYNKTHPKLLKTK